MRMPPAALHLAFRIRRVFSSPMKSLEINCPVRSPFPWKKDPAPITNPRAQNSVDRWLPELSPLRQKDACGGHSEISNRVISGVLQQALGMA